MALITGTDYNDRRTGTAADDTLLGLDGDDTLEGGEGADSLVGGEGRDLASYAHATQGVIATLDLPEANEGEAAGDTYDSVEDLEGSGRDDGLIGDELGNRLAGGDGLYGQGGDDTLEGGAGDDALFGDNPGDAGNDLLDGGMGDDWLYDSGGDDTLVGGAGQDTVVLSGSRAGYAVTHGNDSLGAWTRVQDTDATDDDEGTDLLRGIETLEFADAAGPICFLTGTLIATPAGEVPVEALRPGDLVRTAAGEALPLRWLGRQTISIRFADPLRALPIRIRAGALDEGVPARDLLLSPCHAVLAGGVLAQAGALVNGVSILRAPPPAETFTYWHLELDRHALVLAEGAPAESFVDNVDRLGFDNWAEHEAPCPEGRTIEEMPLPRAKSHRQVPPALRRQIATRAALLAETDTAESAA